MKRENYFNAAKIDELMTGKKIAYSINEAAELIGVCTGHLRNENKRKRLKFIRSGRRILILDSELRRYLEEQDTEQA